MRRRPAPARLDGIARCGALLVLALVVALPLTLAFCPASALDGGASGAGTGDVVAAALTSLDRDLQGSRALPAPALARGDLAVPPSAGCVPLAHAPIFDATAPPCDGALADVPGDARAGPAGLGHQLRL